jgi:hypothetical protein
MPEVDDFSPLAQRELKAKAAADASVDKKRPGLFARLTGRIKDTDDSQLDGAKNAAEPARQAPSGVASTGRHAGGSLGGRGEGEAGTGGSASGEQLLGPRRPGIGAKAGTR